MVTPLRLAPALQLVPEPTPGPGGYKRYFIKATNFQASVVDTVFDVEDPVIGTVLWVEGPKKTPNIAGIAHVTTNLVSCEDRLSDPKTRRATANILEIGSKVRATQTVWIGCDRH